MSKNLRKSTDELMRNYFTAEDTFQQMQHFALCRYGASSGKFKSRKGNTGLKAELQTRFYKIFLIYRSEITEREKRFKYEDNVRLVLSGNSSPRCSLPLHSRLINAQTGFAEAVERSLFGVVGCLEQTTLAL